MPRDYKTRISLGVIARKSLKATDEAIYRDCFAEFTLSEANVLAMT